MEASADSLLDTPARSVTALAYGPGFASTGTPVSVALDEQGFSFHAPDGRSFAASWQAAEVRRHGFEAGRCEIAWRSDGAQLALSVGEGAAVAALVADTVQPPQASGSRGRARSRSRARSRARDAATRRWTALLLAFTAVPVVVVALAVWQFDALVNWAVARVSITSERKLGAAILNRYTAKWQPVDGPAADLVRDLGRRLTQRSRYTYEFRIVGESTINAYALPGGYVVIHAGLLRAVDHADQLAGVLAHEISHVELRHGLRGLVRSAGLTAAVQLLLGGGSALATMAGEVTDLKFSRAAEAEADLNAIDRLEAAGINPAGLVDFLKKTENQAARMPDWLSTHPVPDERIAALEVAFAKLPAHVRQIPRLDYDLAAISAALPEPAAPQ